MCPSPTCVSLSAYLAFSCLQPDTRISCDKLTFGAVAHNGLEISAATVSVGFPIAEAHMTLFSGSFRGLVNAAAFGLQINMH